MISVVEESIEEVPESIQKRLKNSLEESDWEYLEEEVPLALSQIQEGLQNISSIVLAMKKFSHPGTEEKQRVDLNEILNTTLIVARNEWKYFADIEKHFDSSIPKVPCYVNEINQAILNMIVNSAHAIKRSPLFSEESKGKITITTYEQGENVTIQIGDNGEGIPQEIQENIFDPFFTTKEVGEGTGQGLYIAHQAVVERHGGKLWFESEPGKGTVFFIQLPFRY